MADFEALPSRADVVNAYRLALGRDPEVDSVIVDRLSQPNRVWFPPFFASGEYHDNIVDRVVARRPLNGDIFSRPPDAAFTAWVAEFVPLGADGRSAAAAAADWLQLFHALYADAEFHRTVLSRVGGGPGQAFLAELEAHHRRATGTRVKGVIESVADGEVSGWAVDVGDPARSPALELFIDGRFVAATSPDRPRPDLDVAGRPGFVLRYAPPETRHRDLGGEVRDLASGAVIGAFRIPGSRRQAIDALTETRAELAEIRALLDRIAMRLPEVRREFGFPLGAWDAYFETYYATQPRPGGLTDTDTTVIVDARTADVPVLDAMLASLFEQRAWPRAVVILHDDGDTRIEAGMRIDAWRGRFGDRVTTGGVPSGRGAAAALPSAMTRVETRHLIVCTDCGVFAPDAIERLVDALSAGASIAFADDDDVEREDDVRPRHARPRLRGGYDYDLLLQTDAIGPLAGIARELFARIDPAALAAAPLVDLALRADEAGLADRIVHVPRVLLHRVAGGDTRHDGHRAAIRAHLARVAPEVAVEPHRDPLDAVVAGASSIRWPIAAGTRVAIVIPTRDRLDLLKPCLDGILRSLPRNRVAIEIVVVDNRSEQAATCTALADYAEAAPVRVLSYDGGFNWAAINNHAAAAIDADVLVFLNNDTVVLSPDCWDVLASQALRPRIGAVGARLLYADGTIQHAGAVMDPWHSFVSHEGVGDPGGDPGYLGRHAFARQAATVTGACLATRADLFRDSGGFDAVAFPVEGNDTDYCLRLRSQGYAILYEPAATLYHFESRSRGYNDDDAKRRRAYRATRLLRERWADPYEHDPFYNPHFDRLAPPFTRLQPPPHG